MGIHEHSPPQGNAATRRGRIPEDFVAAVNERADVLEIVQRSVKLKKAGANNYLGLCPFHKERTPSFTVTPSKGMYKCFGCGAAGGPLMFLMEHDGVPFRDAVKELAQSCGMPLPPELSDNDVGQPTVDTSPLYSAMETASHFFIHALRHTPAAIAYLKSRGINAATVKRFGIGFAPDEWRSLREAFPDYAENPFIVQCGLIREKESGSAGQAPNRYDTFRNRIMFPVRDTRGRITAFGGRILGAGEPKYMNSPESPIFNKSGALFGLFEARESIRREKIALLVEGYMDVAMLAQNGVEYAVAAMGTSLTRWHLERLLTQTDCVVFAFDGDAAGQKAADRALETVTPILEDHHDFRFLVLPDGKDPDEVVQVEGPAAFLDRVRRAPSYSEFLVSQAVRRNNNLASAEDRARFAAEAGLVAGRLSYRTKLRRILLQQIAHEAQIPGAALSALQAQSASRKPRLTLWDRMAAAAVAAPDIAIEERDTIMMLLDHEHPQEQELVAVLNALQPVAAGNAADSQWLIARDTLRAAIDLIAAHREEQAMQELRAAYQRGQIDEQAFAQQAMAIRQTDS